MRRLRVGIIDLVTKSESNSLYGHIMNANLASIMPQVLATWCEQDGHEVNYFCYTGPEDLSRDLPQAVDLVFVGAFTQAAFLAYAISNRYRQAGVVTVLGGPHARCYPEDSQKYFDYVTGFTDRQVVRDILRDCCRQTEGVHLAAEGQPSDLPGVKERWKYVELTLKKAPLIRIVPMLGSLGCPYTCSFCIDSTVPYRPLDTQVLKEDLAFLLSKFKRPKIGWHDPNFGIRFDEVMGAIEEAVPPDSIDFIAESSLSLLSEDHLKRLKRNGFKAILPGIESWYDMGNKSKTGKNQGLAKVEQVAEHVNMILEYLPYIQTNFVLGLDCDEGDEPFELTKRFLDLAPGAFPAYSLLTSFGEAAPLNLEYQKAGRVLPVPFHVLNNNHAMNLKPAHYDWPTFYDGVVDVTSHAFSWKAIGRRYRANSGRIPRWMNVLRAVSSEGFGRIKYHTEVRRRLDSDLPFRRFLEGDSTDIPEFFLKRIRDDLGAMYRWLPDGALYHDPNAYLTRTREAEMMGRPLVPLRAAPGAAVN